MTHLTPQQFVDAVDGTLPAVHSDHLSVCSACREEIASLSALVGEVEAVEASEPSPLFWAHFSRRVHDATSAEPVPSSSGWWKSVWNPMVTLGLAAATMAIVLSVRSMPRPSDAVETFSAVTPVTEDAMASDASQDDPLTFVARIASALPADDLQQTAAPTRDVANAALEDLNAPFSGEARPIDKGKDWKWGMKCVRFVRKAILAVAAFGALTGVASAQDPPAQAPPSNPATASPAPPGRQGRAGGAAGRAAQQALAGAVTPAQVSDLLDAYVYSQAQRALQMTNAQYNVFLPKLVELQTLEKRHRMQRNKALADLRTLVNPKAPTTADDASISAATKAVDDLEVQMAQDEQHAMAAVDSVLTVRQRAHFRIFLEQMERAKIDFLVQAKAVYPIHRSKERPLPAVAASADLSGAFQNCSAVGADERGRPAGRAAVPRPSVCRRAPGGAVPRQDPPRQQF